MLQLAGGIRFPGGFHLDARVRAEMTERWNLFRAVASGLTVMAGVPVALFGFIRAWVAVVLAVVVLLHALGTRAGPRAGTALAVDITLSFLALELIGVPTPVLAIAYVTYGVVTTLLCGPMARTALGVYASVLFAGAAFMDLPAPMVPTGWAQTAGWIAAAIFLALLLAMVAMTLDLLQNRVETIDRANSQLEAMARSKDELIATVSHEIRTPLAGVLGFSTELQDSWEALSPAEGSEFAGLIASESREIAHIVDDLVVAARADLGSLAIRLEPVQVRREIEDFLGECPRLDHPIALVGEDIEVEMDPPRFRQILRHLLRNAIAYGGEQIWIETMPGPGVGFVRVCDDGDGISEEQRDLVFTPYQRAHHNPTQPGSFGLGLTIARRLADAMGGSLTYQRPPGAELSIFEVTLRQSPSQDRPPASVSRTNVAKPIPMASARQDHDNRPPSLTSSNGQPGAQMSQVKEITKRRPSRLALVSSQTRLGVEYPS